MSSDDNSVIVSPNASLVEASEVPALLDQVRPAWKAKSLIVRVQRLITVDPSSACQRLLNAAIHDLKEKIAVAGIDIAKEAAKNYKLPPIEKSEDIDNYSTSNSIDLAYRMGLLTRPEWRRVSRCYEIRRDLEHEDDEYEAGVEDCIYIFKTCIEAILSKDPIHLLKVTDVKELVEEATPVTPAESLIEDFSHAPQPRQEEICKFLISIALDKEQSDIVQQNSYAVLGALEPHTQNSVKLKIAQHIQEKVGRSPLERRHVRVSLAGGFLPYLRKNQVRDFYRGVLSQMEYVGSDWRAHDQHGELLRSFKEVGGLKHCPEDIRKDILRWLVRTYIGTPGGMTRHGHVRNVFYSDTAAPIIRDLIAENAISVKDQLIELSQEADFKEQMANRHTARRFEALVDIVDESRD